MQHIRKGKGSILRIIGIVKDAEGNEVSRFTKDNDIFLWNFAVLIAQFLKINFVPTDTTVYSFVSTDGTTRTTTYNQFAANSGSLSDNINSKWRVQIGGGATGAAVTDYSLVSGLQEVVPTLPEIIVDGSILKIAFSSTFAFAAQTVVQETSIKANGGIINSDTPYIITRDTFTAQTVPAGGSITIQHELWFNGTPPAA